MTTHSVAITVYSTRGSNVNRGRKAEVDIAPEGRINGYGNRMSGHHLLYYTESL